MLVTFLLQKPKLLMKYFILIFFLFNTILFLSNGGSCICLYIYIVCLMSVYVCMYMYWYTQKGFICNKDYLIKLISNNIMQLIRIRL